MKYLLVAKILFLGFVLVKTLDPSTVILAIDCGNRYGYTTSSGIYYSPDNYYSTSHTHTYLKSVARTKDQFIYQSHRDLYRQPSLSYRIPIAGNGTYVLILQFAEIYYKQKNERIFTVKIGSYVVKNSLDVALVAGINTAYDIFVEFQLSNGLVYINGNYISDAYISGSLAIDLISIKSDAMISGIILVKGNCSVADNCEMCYDRKCTNCIELSATCDSCIENASVTNGKCYCNPNRYYDSTINSCSICHNLCKECSGSNWFQCSSCNSSYYLVSGVCLRACPYGFTSSCQKIDGTVIDASFSDYFYGVYGNFITGNNENSCHFFNSPETDDPIPAKNRGLYFSEGAYLKSSSAIYFSIDFSLGIWVWISPGSGDILNHCDSRIKISETGVLNILLENSSEWTFSISTNSLSPANSAWVYLSYVISFSSPSTTIKTSLNGIIKQTLSQSGFIYRDLPGGIIILGKSSDSNFKGFIYKFQLWNSAVQNFDIQYFDQLCGTAKISSCLWSCDISSWISNGEIIACDESCTKGCIRKETCNVCYDPLCSVCSGFSDGLCSQCVANASGTPCSCNQGFKISTTGLSCSSVSDELMLSENVFYDENLQPHEWKFYNIPFYEGHRDIVLTINTEFSSPKIYINLNSDNIWPDITLKDYYFDSFVNNTLKITLNWDSIAYLKCNSELKGHYDPNKECAYHIGILSSANTAYSIKFKSIPLKPKVISIGTPIISNMSLYDHKFYYGISDTNGPTIVKVNNLSGRSELFISLFDYELAGNNPAKWPLAYTSSYSYNTSKAFDEITFEESSLISICPSKKCLIEICEICRNGPCKVELSLLNQKSRFIKPNIYYNGTVCFDCFHYYEIPFYFGHKNIKIVLTPTFAELDLYVTLNTNNKNPDINTYNYKLQANEQKSEEITLEYDAIARKNCPLAHSEASSCVYHIGIYGYRQSDYNLIYYEFDLSDNLRTGSIHVKPIALNEHGVYNSLIDCNYNATIIIDKLISGKMNINIYDYEEIKYDLQSLLSNDAIKANFTVEEKFDRISLTNDSLISWCPSKLCLAQICLYCSAKTCYPKLQVIQDNEIILENGKIYNSQVEESTFKDYKIPFSYGHKNIYILLEVYKGDAEIYISLNDYNERPTLNFYDYKPIFNSSKAEITLVNDEIASSNCPHYEGSAVHDSDASCFYHIGIYGKKVSVFSIQIYSNSTTPKEIKSNSLYSQQGVNSAEDRLFNIMNTEKSATVMIEIISGEFLIYVSLFDFAEIGRDVTSWPLPKETKKQYKSQAEYSDEISIENDILQENCPSGLCIALLCGFCLSDTCEYQIEVKQKIVEGQEDLLISGSQLGIMLFCVFIGLFGIFYYRNKMKNSSIKDLENLTEPLMVETQESALFKNKDQYFTKE